MDNTDNRSVISMRCTKVIGSLTSRRSVTATILSPMRSVITEYPKMLSQCGASGIRPLIIIQVIYTKDYSTALSQCGASGIHPFNIIQFFNPKAYSTALSRCGASGIWPIEIIQVISAIIKISLMTTSRIFSWKSKFKTFLSTYYNLLDKYSTILILSNL